MEDYDLGTTKEIREHNLNLILRNRDRIEHAIKGLEGEDETRSPTIDEFEGLTEHLQPPRKSEPDSVSEESSDASSTESQSRDIEFESGILEEIESALEDL